MIDTQAIRNKVLDLALRGKLTEQLQEDGTAEELFQQIQQEKQTFGKAGKKANPLPPLLEKEKPYQVPENWKWVRFDEISNIIGTGLIRAGNEQFKQAKYYYFKMNNIGNFDGRCNFDNMVMVEATDDEYEKYKLEIGDFLFNTRNSKELVGKSAVVSCVPKKIILNNNILKIRFLGGIIPEYIELFFISSQGRSQLSSFVTSTTNVAAIYQRQLITMPLPLPPLPEQHRIVERINDCFSILDTIDALQTQYHDNLTILKSKLIDAGIQGKLTEQLSEDGTAEELYQQIQQEKQTLEKAGKIKKSKPLPPVSDEEKPFDIPENWKWVRIASLGTTTTGGTPSKDHPEYYGGNYPFFKPSDLDRGHHITKASEYLTEFGKEASRQLPKGSLLVCCIGSIGKCAIIDIDGTANQQINALAPIMCDSDYLLYAIDNDAFKYQLNQGSRATTVSIINKNKFDNCIIPLPPLAEQKRIVDKLEELLPLCKG